MSLWDDYKADGLFERDYPFGLPGKEWKSREGPVLVTNMTEAHIKHCMEIVGQDDEWYGYFQKELDRRNND